ncbi:dolichol-phosphate mannosyltransferase subunit 3 [Lentinula guzmanii]|uniref:Dolichol-phosphate mannosyltransferase subunit 3 n=2 Tax=Lentinula TaxID=5352 RepID=A0AA38MV30_9AGAR|nr:dolichol-phosphate mannosyltransferase subunit 3 [Lentinula guzmanii]KAJ3780615.1 dolichol-phosphate mannosyltransferase subunit 3 [Lentinula aff. detonsa]KAJ3795329.1 dolichol-phosphate mannosyltransferase subunit 3 [Lentinula aff. detonsa]
MTRAQRVAVISTIFASLYFLALFEILQVPLIEGKVVQEILPALPWWLLVSFGSYSLWSLGWGLFTFRDCPEAYEELLNEISQAKNDLRNRGVNVD